MRITIVCTLLLALALPGCGGGKETGTKAAASADSTDRLNLVLAEVGGTVVTAGDLRLHMVKRSGPDRVDEMMKNPDILHAALSSLVDQYVWAEYAKQQGMQLTPDEQRQIKALEAELLAKRYVADVLQGEASPTEENARKWYDEHQENYLTPVRVAARHIQVATKAEAEKLQERIQNGEDFTKLARQYSKDAQTRDLGGALGYVEAGKPILGFGRNVALERAILALNEGQTTVVHTDKGWHVVLAQKKEGGTIMPFDEVRDQITEALGPRLFARVYQQKLIAAREAVGYKYNAKNMETFSGVANNTARLMLVAAQQSDWEAKLEIYRRVAYDFPDEPQAAEAQFMMGYTYMKEGHDPSQAKRELSRLVKHYPKSKWRKGADYLLAHLDMDPEDMGTPVEILQAGKK